MEVCSDGRNGKIVVVRFLKYLDRPLGFYMDVWNPAITTWTEISEKHRKSWDLLGVLISATVDSLFFIFHSTF